MRRRWGHDRTGAARDRSGRGRIALVGLLAMGALGVDAGSTMAGSVAVPPRATQPNEVRAATATVPLPPSILPPPMVPDDRPAWRGPSVVRLRAQPDRYVRPPDTPYRSFTLAATGDLLIHTPVRTRAATPGGGFDFGPQLANARADIAGADLGLCHLEVPLDPDGPYSSYPTFNAPAQLADGIQATGWDACSTASNHSADKGFAGLVSTLDALDSAGVVHAGTYRTAEAADTPLIVVANGVRVGLISATYGLNGLPYPDGHTWSVQLIDVPQIQRRAHMLRETGAEVVIVSLHWGEEYQHQPSAFQRRVAEELMTDRAIDAIVGHHAHVVQPVERIDGRPVVFGLGNFLSGQRPTERRDGAVVTLTFEEAFDGWHVETIHAQPTWVDDAYAVVTADPDQGGVLGASAQRTLGYLGVPLSPPPPAERLPATHYGR